MLHYNKGKLLEIGKKNEQAEIDCLKRFIRIPTCYYKKHDLKPIITQMSKEFETRGYKVQTFSTGGRSIDNERFGYFSETPAFGTFRDS